MLILARKVGESIVIDGRIVVRIMAINPRGGRVQVGIQAPDEVPVMRQELLALEPLNNKRVNKV